jgi:hypothetical protein
MVALSIQLHAQAPQAFDFQGIARNASGEVIANSSISLKLSIRSSTTAGSVVYTEKHQPTTSAAGIFTVSVGSASGFNGPFQQINWKSDKYFLQVEIDPAGGENYTSLGASQISSVPFALHSTEASRWKNDDPIIQTGEQGNGGILPVLNFGPTLIWYPRIGAFRAGYTDGITWANENIGDGSAAFGSGIASGTKSFATGDATASGVCSIAMGNTVSAIGSNSVALGVATHANGYAAFAANISTIAKSFASTSFGYANDDQDNPSSNGSPDPSDRIFQIGNGAAKKRSNALTLLRNGNLGLGNNVLDPQYILDIGARPRIRHNENSPNGSTAGIYFDDSKGSPQGFVGFKKDDEIGFYHGGKWAFWIDNLGDAHIIGSNYNSSDLRLKRNLSSLSNSLTKLSDLNGYHYFWKDSTLDQTLQTGLIAQEVETHFPELVKTDDKGFKSVNYTGLIPHLIESVKELKASVEYLHTLNDQLKAQASEMDSFRKELKVLRATSSTETSALSDKAGTVSPNSKFSEK